MCAQRIDDNRGVLICTRDHDDAGHVYEASAGLPGPCTEPYDEEAA